MAAIEAGDPRQIDRLPPQNPEAEEAVLGSCLMAAEAMHAVRPILSPADFYRSRNGAIWSAMCRLFDKREPVDSVTLADELTRCGEYEEVGGFSYVFGLLGTVPTWIAAEHYAGIVKRCAVKRRLISAAGKIAAIAYDDSLEPDEVQARALSLINGIRASSAKYRIYSGEEMAGEFLDLVEGLDSEESEGVRTGFLDLDRLIGGLMPGDLAILVADTSVGKSAAALTICRHVGASGRDAVLCSVEMNRRQLEMRMAAAMMGMSWQQFRHRWRNRIEHEALQSQVAEAANQFAEGNVHVFYKPSMTMADIRAEATKWAATHGLGILAVDYLQILTMAPAESKRVQVDNTLKGLKSLAGELEVPVLVLCQLNRDLKGRSDKRPTLHDAKETSGIEQDADLLLGLYRDDFYYRAGEKNDRKEVVEKGKAELLVLKNRNGPTGSLNLTWLPATVEYANYAGPEMAPWR